MSVIISTQAELLKTKRTAAFWLTFAGACFIPLMFFIALFTGNDASRAGLLKDPWGRLFNLSFQMLSGLVPMFIILLSTLIIQIEYRNNTWKQVFATPQSVASIFFSKFITIHLMIVCCFLLFNVFLILAGVFGNLLDAKLTFLHRSIDWEMVLRRNIKTYVSILGISAIQFWLSLRFKNFIVPIGIGLALVIGAIIALNLQWKHIYKYPFAFPMLTFDFSQKLNRPYLENHELNSIGYFIAFVVLGFFDLKWRKEKG